MERHEAARVARREFSAVLDRVKAECGIERQKVAEILGVSAPLLSRMAAEEVRDRPTLAPPDDWRAQLAAGLDTLGKQAQTIAASITPRRARRSPRGPNPRKDGAE